MHIYMQNQRHTIRTSDTVLRKIYLSLYLKGFVWEGVGDLTELQHIDPHSIGHNCVSFPFSWATQPEAWEPTLLAFSTASCHQRVWSPNWSDFLSSPNYIIVQRPLLLVGVTIALIQPIHGQCYNSDIPRPDAPVIYVGAFPILTARPGHRSICNINLWISFSKECANESLRCKVILLISIMFHLQVNLLIYQHWK